MRKSKSEASQTWGVGGEEKSAPINNKNKKYPNLLLLVINSLPAFILVCVFFLKAR